MMTARTSTPSAAGMAYGRPASRREISPHRRKAAPANCP